MLLKNKNAVIYGAGGAIGAAVARAFAREGAKVFLSGRTVASLEIVAEKIKAEGGMAEVAQIDATNAREVESYLNGVVKKAGSVDISFNAIGLGDTQMFEAGIAEKTLLKRLPKLNEVANTAVLVASDYASAMTGAIANITCGEIVD